jgi:hypothetical protein
MDYPTLMGVVYSLADPAKQFQSPAPRQPFMPYIVAYGHAANQFHGEVVFAILGDASFEYGGDRRMLQARQGLDLVLKQRDLLPVRMLTGTNDFDGYATTGILLLGLINDAHASATDFGDDAISGNRLG